ncbi:hypothetical protein FIBSPDRAFT_105279 [Athelia psychrophila]|uniref:Transmembrane protein n=1 Tax=Athelia psychrophila TaxID=1759441 RepID=A0A166DB46_9AGAM|nr:hypothetical protein FIBSPDRAFT_105279 [Fibularhizoctonia sp. CBS 109695]
MPSSRDATSSHPHLPYDALATEDAFKATSPLSSRHVFSTKSFALQCLLPPLIGLSFVALGLYIVYTPDPIIISYSTTNTIVLSQAFTALFAIWHFLALMPVLDAVRSVRSEEWWRRLTHSASFSRVNAVSSNIGGNLAHGLDILGPWSSYAYQAAWLIAILCVAIADIGPGAIHVDIGLRAIDAEYKVPALPPDSIFGNYSRPFYMTSDFFHASVDIAPMYYASLLVAQSYVTAGPPVPNAIVPRPSVTAGTGYRYSTDVAFLNYQCDWYAPEIAGPETMSDFTSQSLFITANDIRGIGFAPVDSNSIYIINDNRNATTNQPSFAGDLVFVVSSGTPVTPEYGFLNLSTIPTYALSPAWTAVAAAYRANYTGMFSPPQYLSAAVCTSNFTIESWTVEMMGGSVKLLEKHPQIIGNLDVIQLQLAIQDSFGMLAGSAPIVPAWGFSETSFVTFFNCPTDSYILCEPKSGADISELMNTQAIPSLIQAYLDDFPFGNFTPDGSKQLTPALVLVAQKDFVYFTAGLYALLGITLVFISGRVPAPALDIQRVIDVTKSADSEHNAYALEGRAVATTVQRIAHLGRDGNDAETENRVRHVIGSSTVTFRENTGFEEQPTLALETATRVFTPNARRERIENARNRYTWVLTPALGAALVAFGLEVYLRPRAIASATASRAAVYASLFTWVIGIWRSASLVAITALLRRANSDVRAKFQLFR